MPAGTSISTSSIFIFGMAVTLLGSQAATAIGGDAPFQLRAEMADQTLDGPRRGIAQGADRVSLDLPRDVLKHVDLLARGVADHQPFHHAPHPARAFAARRALATAFVLVE